MNETFYYYLLGEDIWKSPHQEDAKDLASAMSRLLAEHGKRLKLVYSIDGYGVRLLHYHLKGFVMDN